MELNRKLEILADAAKYDASCASSAAAGGGALVGWHAGEPAFRHG